MDDTIEIRKLAIFDKSYEKLKKKYPNIHLDLNPIIEEFWNSHFPGVKDNDFNYPVYKVRIPSRDQQKGQRGGFRLIYLKRDTLFILLMLIYSKSDQDDLTKKQIKDFNKELDNYYKMKGWKK